MWIVYGKFVAPVERALHFANTRYSLDVVNR